MSSIIQSSIASSYRLPTRPALGIRRIDPGQGQSPEVPNVLRFLDESYDTLRDEQSTSDDAYAAVDKLFKSLASVRLSSTSNHWASLVQEARQHPICSLVHQDPFTRRAFEKPRSYAGDAVMMDYIYGCEENWEMPDATTIGRHVFEYTSQADASAGVRSRREHISYALDDLAIRTARAEVLAVACGHLREASMSSAVRRRRFSRFLALDSDSLSLEEVDRCYVKYGVSPRKADVRRMITGRLDLGTFDLVYSTGLYDYLNESTGAKLTYNLFSMLKPNGRLIVANFLPSIPDIGYMETYMDWWLIYRDRIDMVALTQFIPQEAIQNLNVCVEENQNIIFLEITRRR